MLALALGSLFFTSRIAGRLEQQTILFTDVFARFAASATLTASEDRDVRGIFVELMEQVDFPIVVTDRRGVPWAWKGTEVPSDAVPFGVFATTDPSNPPSGPVSTLLGLAWKMDTEHTPIPMVHSETGQVSGHIHYGNSPLVAQLRLMPIIQIGIGAFLLIFAYLGLRSIRWSEKRSIWVGMARETAHQLGTPISSLMGWVDLLEAEKERPVDDSTLMEMRRDISRLTKIAERFERIGSSPKLEPHEVDPIVSQVVDYLGRRVPTRSRRMEIVKDLGEVGNVATDPELLSWTVENLVKNSLDSLARGEGDGRVTVRTERTAAGVRILVEDNGPGVPESIQRRVFDAGFTTRRKGWGLGLALARRIVEEYHGGKLRLLHSKGGVSTVFSVELPAGGHSA
ncbi:MAG: HAMP domain-containing sensor histidine kinase [Gemmatimonadota bacterium]|jgi:hypothetical protein|nr:HAMP domain-containing sensor histidine kinase [Gemmatimonadota bacterium]